MPEHVILKDEEPVAESDEDKPGVILECDERGDLVSLEILDASERVSEARKIEFRAPAHLLQQGYLPDGKRQEPSADVPRNRPVAAPRSSRAVVHDKSDE